MALLEIRDLSTRFYTYEGVVQALDNISLTIERGETFGLVGESGCGKSVTVQSLMGLVRPPGRVEGGGIRFYPDKENPERCLDILSLSETEMQRVRGRQIAMIFQEPNAALDPIMTVGKQVAEVFSFHYPDRLCNAVAATLERDPRAYGVAPLLLRIFYNKVLHRPDSPWTALLDRLPFFRRWRTPLWMEALKQAGDLLGRLGIAGPHDILSQYPHQLSGGMKQRVVIAMALAGAPVLLIADEATSNLDVTIQAQILELIVSLKKESLSALLFITHDLGLVAEVCDRVGVMYAGTLCEVASVKELFREPAHPYTRALLESVPKLTVRGELSTIVGSVPNLITPPSGCRFHPRCRSVSDICKDRKPAMVSLSATHQAACHHVEAMK